MQDYCSGYANIIAVARLFHLYKYIVSIGFIISHSLAGYKNKGSLSNYDMKKKNKLTVKQKIIWFEIINLVLISIKCETSPALR